MRNLPQRLGVLINYRLLTGREIGSQFLRELGEQRGHDLLFSAEHFEQGGKVDGRKHLIHYKGFSSRNTTKRERRISSRHSHPGRDFQSG